MSKLKLPYAYNSQGECVHIDDAIKSEKYFCPICKKEIRPRQGKIRTHHFAHKQGENHNYSETELHRYFKEIVANFLQTKISNKEVVLFEWDCDKCGEKHQGNLLKKAIKVATEYNLGVCQPDIALFDKEDNVIIVIEVVVTHAPESRVMQYYDEKKIGCLQINVHKIEDCYKIEEKVSHPSAVNICPNPICAKCNKVMNRAKISIATVPCWKCKKSMEIAMIYLAKGFPFYPSSFTSKEIKIANDNGAYIKKGYSNEINEIYYSNHCRHCNAFIGDFHMSKFHNLSIDKEIDIGYKCINCINSNLSQYCPKCNGILVIRKGIYGIFYGCSNYPQCNYTKKIDLNN